MSKSNDYRSLPSLRTLQVFEVAARHSSFTRAAEELHLTQGAVSRQVQELESWLGRTLFVRSGPNLCVSATGTKLGIDVRQALDKLKTAVEQARPAKSGERVTLSMLPSVAAKWIAPRLTQFVQDHPNLDLRITASRHMVDFEREEVDAAIRYGLGRWPGLQATHLANETVFPVCSPEYAQRLGLRSPVDLLSARLLHSDIAEDWRAWFREVGIDEPLVPRGPTIGDDAAMLQAAIDSQGVALGRSILVSEDLRNRRLTAPFPVHLQASYCYWFVIPISPVPRPEIAIVQDWMSQAFKRASCEVISV